VTSRASFAEDPSPPIALREIVPDLIDLDG
jgi:hypothetical protein